MHSRPAPSDLPLPFPVHETAAAPSHGKGSVSHGCHCSAYPLVPREDRRGKYWHIWPNEGPRAPRGRHLLKVTEKAPPEGTNAALLRLSAADRAGFPARGFPRLWPATTDCHATVSARGPQSAVTRTLLKSSAVALISFQVLFNSWMQMPKSSSKARSWVKNMGW